MKMAENFSLAKLNKRMMEMMADYEKSQKNLKVDIIQQMQAGFRKGLESWNEGSEWKAIIANKND